MIQSPLTMMKFIGIMSRDKVPQHWPSLVQADLHVQSSSLPLPLSHPGQGALCQVSCSRGRSVSRTV